MQVINSRVVCACVRVCGVLTLTICNAMMRTAAQQNDALHCTALRCVALRCDLESWIVTESRLHVTF